MLLDLIDSLRCTATHAASWLVLSADTWDDRHILEGRLGCPVCRAEFPITRGVADFTGGQPVPVRPPSALPLVPADSGELLRLAAQLDLREPGGVVLLAGTRGLLADSLAALVPALYAVMNAPASGRGPVSALGAAGRLPFGDNLVRAVALDAAHAGTGLLDEAKRVLRSGGRLVAPATAPVPARVRELARDDREWVGVSEGATDPVVPLQRARA